MGLLDWMAKGVSVWLTKEGEANGSPLYDFVRLSEEMHPCDVLLVAGRSRVSQVIRMITQSVWTHAALYVGRLSEIEDPELRAFIEQHYHGDPDAQLLIETLLGEGTIITPLNKYRHDHLRICRPQQLSRQDAHQVLVYAARHLGLPYDIRQLFDLARFLLPYSFVPRRWRSTLFEHNAGEPTRTVCSTMMAAAFSSVHYPILPVIHRDDDGTLHLYKRNTKLHTPSDFDYSPYFDVVKFPLLGFNDVGVYRQLPWDQNGVICNSDTECYIPEPRQPRPSRWAALRAGKSPETPPPAVLEIKTSKSKH